jgi:flagellin-like protein
MSNMTARSLYGWDPTTEAPTPTPVPLHAGRPEPTMDKTGPRSKAQSPILAVVVLIGLVVLLTQVSFRGTIAVSG